MNESYRNLQNIKSAHAESGRYWFSRATVKFFGSRVHNTRATYDGNGGWLWAESIKRGFETSDGRVSRVVRFDEASHAIEYVRHLNGDAVEFATPLQAKLYIHAITEAVNA